MVRLLFNGPEAAASVQKILSRQVPGSRSPAAIAQSKTQNAVEQRPNLTAEEQLSLKQQQSLEMVQIMLHVSVSVLSSCPSTSLTNPILRSGHCSTFGLPPAPPLWIDPDIYTREFLPLSCFDDRDLKQAQRENKFSYREFINGKARSDKPDRTRELAFGQGKRGQPLKIIIRHSDPKADLILDVLVSLAISVLALLTSVGTWYFWCSKQKSIRSHPIKCPRRQRCPVQCIGVLYIHLQVLWRSGWCG